MNPYGTPDLAPQFQSELDDYDLANKVRNQSLDPQQIELRRQAGPKSAWYATQDQNMQAQDMRNKAQVFRNRAQGAASDRDLEWRRQQDAQDFQRKMMERQMTNQEGAVNYQHQRDTLNDNRAEKSTAINYAMALMGSPDARQRAEGQDRYDAIMRGGAGSGGATGAAPSAAGGPSNFVQQAQGELVGPQAGPMAPATGAAPASGAPAMGANMAQYIKERDAQMARQDQLNAQSDAQTSYNFDQRKLHDTEDVKKERRQSKLDIFKMALANAQSPDDRTAALNGAALAASDMDPMTHQPTGGMGIGAVGDVLKSAYNGSAGAIFRTDPLQQAQYEATQKRALQGINQQAGFQGAEDAIKVMRYDPAIANAVTGLQRELASHGDAHRGMEVLKGVGTMLLSPVGLGGKGALRTGSAIFGNSPIADEKIAGFASKIKQLADSAAARYPGVDPESLRQVILSKLNDTLQSPSFDNTRRQQFADSLYAQPSATPSPGAKASAFGNYANREGGPAL